MNSGSFLKALRVVNGCRV